MIYIIYKYKYILHIFLKYNYTYVRIFIYILHTHIMKTNLFQMRLIAINLIDSPILFILHNIILWCLNSLKTADFSV